MADTKISGLTAYAGTSVSASIDVLPIVDTTNSITKKITVSNLATAIGSVANIVAGTIIDFAGTSAPAGYLNCDGSAVSRSTYSALFSAIGTTWGSGDGSTTFNVPNLNRRTTIGSGGSGTSTIGNAVGNTGGEESHALTSGELASHTHGIPTYGGGSSGTTALGKSQVTDDGGTLQSTGATNSSGSGTAHNNIQPSAVVLKCIKT